MVRILKHAICMTSPLLLPGNEKGTPAALPPKPEQIQDLRGPAPGTKAKTHVLELLSHLRPN